MLKKIILFWSALFLLSACSVGPDYRRPEMGMPLSFKEAPAGFKPAYPQDACARGAWWAVFNDPVLNQLEEKLTISNQNIHIAVAQYHQARALLGEAQSGYFPTVNANLGVDRQRFGTNTSTASISSNNTNSKRVTTNYTALADASWEPDIWGGVRRAVESGHAGVEVSLAQLASVRLLAQASLAQYYFQLRGLDSAQHVLNETVASYERLMKITQNQYKAGVVARSQILQVQSQLQQAQVQAIDNRVLRAQYEHAIATLMGDLPAQFSLAPALIVFEPPLIPIVVPSTLLERRPDIAAAERQVAKANAEIGFATAAYFPVLTLSGEDGFSGASIAHLFSASSQVWSLGSQLAGTLFDGGLKHARVKAAKAVHEEAMAMYRQTVLTAFQEVEDNLSSLRLMGQEVMMQRSALATAEEALKFVTNEYKAGTVGLLDVLNAEVTALTARKNLSDVSYRRMMASVGLIKALGGGWSRAEEKENL